MNDIYFSLDNHSRIQLLQFDLSSAFGSIYNNILINRLSQIGITGDALKILILLIKDRTYSVNIHIVFNVKIFHYIEFHRDPH